METWKDVKGFEGFYRISNLGNLWSVKRIITFKDGRKRCFGSQMITSSNDKDGYKVACLKVNQVKSNVKIHRLVAQAFIENPENKPQVNHLDEVKYNNNYKNLEWATNSENQNHNNLKNKISKKIIEKYSMPIIQLKNGVPVKFWRSGREAGRCGFNQGNINNVLKGRSKTHLGFTFEYL